MTGKSDSAMEDKVNAERSTLNTEALRGLFQSIFDSAETMEDGFFPDFINKNRTFWPNWSKNIKFFLQTEGVYDIVQ